MKGGGTVSSEMVLFTVKSQKEVGSVSSEMVFTVKSQKVGGLVSSEMVFTVKSQKVGWVCLLRDGIHSQPKDTIKLHVRVNIATGFVIHQKNTDVLTLLTNFSEIT